ncbi:MAG: hypothetical protein A2026_00390 [Deltaproteobacteria bacterium RBG_19FT_COMBO_46_12]|nr:MAG: hypothetical protein A2026_00390 [Deltaproteobacteria bacterium RBG_19FT_COMBO_46_12]
MRKDFLLRVLCCLLLLLSVTACKQKEEARKAAGGPVVAKINDKEITLSEFTERIKEYPALAHGGEMTEETQKGFLDNLIVRELIFQEALRLGIDKDKETIDFIEEMKKRVIVDKFFKKEVDQKTQVSKEEIKKFFDENPEESKSPDEVRASHILLKTREEADMVLKKVKQGAKFEDLAKKFSMDPGSKDSGGDLGFFSQGMMVPEFDAVAFKLKVGDVSDIVQSRFGFHIIKVLEKKEGKQKSVEESKPEIEKKLLAKKRKDTFDTLVSDLKSKAKISINNDLLLGSKGAEKPNDK